MRRQPWGLYAIALAIVVVGLAAVGVPVNPLIFGAFLLVCPLMMLVMMGGMHGGHGGAEPNTEDRARVLGPHDQNQDPIVRR